MMGRSGRIGRWFGAGSLGMQALAAVVAWGTTAPAANDNWTATPRSVLISDLVSRESQETDFGDTEAQADHPPTTVFSPSCTTEEFGGSVSAESCRCAKCRAGRHCHDGRCCRHGHWNLPGLFQRMAAMHEETGACWSSRTDAIIMWRNAPRYRPLFTTFDPGTLTPGPVALNANGLQSDPLVAPKLSLLRTDPCGDSLELAYLYAGNFYSQRALPYVRDGYATAEPGIYGNAWGAAGTPLSSASATLLGNLQSAEVNGRTSIFGGLGQFLAGFRWLQWNEQLRMTDSFSFPAPPDPITDAGMDIYSTQCFNNLFGGQIGIDATLLTIKRIRFDGVVKAGAYYNAALQKSAFGYMSDGSGGPFVFATNVRNGSPATSSFVGEVGMTAVVPLRHNFDFRVGYFGLWLEGLAQPTNQLSSQTLTQFDAPSGKLNTTGSVVLQGVSLGLEGRW